MIVVIDDERTFDTDDEIVYARTSNEGLAVIAKVWTDAVLNYGSTDIYLYLDHDLGGSDTIMPVVNFLYVTGWVTESVVLRLPDIISGIYVHSQNPTAGDSIVPVLSKVYKNVERIPLPALVS